MISTPEGVLPEDFYNYAMVLKINGKFVEANQWLDSFQVKKPDDLRARNYFANKEHLDALLKDNGKYKINYLDINSQEDDFGTCFYKDKIVFASTKSTPKLIKRKYNWNGKPYLDLVQVDVVDCQFQNPVSFDNTINGKMHDGPASFSNHGDVMAFTRNNYDAKHKDKVINLQLFFSTYQGDKWSKPTAFAYNSLEYSVGHPNLTEDGNTLYFTSDMPGGFGKADLYRTKKNENGEWEKPVNLGHKINTEGDEMFPYFEAEKGILFFSSNGRFGIGGLDIFNCAVEGIEFGPAYNVGFPLNTQNDDYAFIVDAKTNIGYVSSNRSGAGDDIYSVNIKGDFEVGKRIKGIAKTNKGIAIPNTFVTLFDNVDNILDTFPTQIDGAFLFLVESDKKFMLNGRKLNFLDGTKSVNSEGEEFIITADIVMLEQVTEPPLKDTILEKQLKVGDDLAKVINTKTTYEGDFKTDMAYFDLDKANIRPDAKIELDKIAKIMNKYPDMVIELGAFTDCSGRQVYNQELSERRAKASINYIKAKISKPERIYGRGYGESKLLNGCNCEGSFLSTCPDNENQKNRRTEFIIIKK